MKLLPFAPLLAAALAYGRPALSAETVTFLVPESERGVEPLVREAVGAGRARVEKFFGRPIPKPFTVEVLPSRGAMDAAFAKRWGMPKTECWMVAAGVADRLYVLSPRLWKAEACEHDSAPAHVGEIAAHELVHVFHGQHAPNPEFDGMDDLGWFVEGLATLVSGQFDGAHAGDARAALAAGAGPKSLATAWSGRYKYGVCGSLVRFAETGGGRARIEKLLRAGTNAEALAILATTEQEFLAAWHTSVLEPPKR